MAAVDNLTRHQFASTMRSRDPRDPIYHDVQGDKAEASFVARHNRWAAKQPKDVQARFCEHGYYVGHKGALAGSCPGCAAKGEE